MTPLEELLAAEIRQQESIGFERFMEAALYHPDYGYYRRARDPFGFEGDFYTSSQMQPVFGRLLAQKIDAWRREVGAPADFTVVELGAGRGETIAEIKRRLPDLETIAVDVGGGEIPERFTGVVLANEFFDALAVSSIERGPLGLIEHRVGLAGERFVWKQQAASDANFDDYIERYFPALPEGNRTNLRVAAGEYSLHWYDPRHGGELQTGNESTIEAGDASMRNEGSIQITPPHHPGKDWVALLRRVPASR